MNDESAVAQGRAKSIGTTTQTAGPAQRDFVGAARRFFVGICWLYAAGVAAQVFAVGMVFLAGQGGWLEIHRATGHSIGFLTVAALISALVARLPWWFVATAFGLIVLHGLQYTLIESTGVVRALHALNAVLLFWLATFLAQRTLRAPRRRRATD